MSMQDLSPKSLAARYRRAKERRAGWGEHWRECYKFVLPQREHDQQLGLPGG